MRHRRLRRKLGVKSKHRKALLRNLMRGLVYYKRIRTTVTRAREASAFADQMITLAKRGDLASRRLLIAKLGSEDVAKTLITRIAPHFKDRKGGYTRILRTGFRNGDGSDMCLLEFSALIEIPEKAQKPKKEKKKKAEAKEADKVEVKEKLKKEKVKEEEEKPGAEALKPEEVLPLKEGKPKPEKEEKKEEKKESEKKGGFLSSLRKFLKGE
ncbi:MAG: 50S ribosomal protein L17 [Candidatus Omnitrophica bacterium]|nr:50S ribosomal protein L17 [Candidatus Omnitrophota bacterium]